MKRILNILLVIAIFVSSFAWNLVPVNAETEATNKIVVALDPGHDAKHGGVVAEELIEQDITLKIANYCKKELEKYDDIEVYMTRTDASCPYPSSKNSGRCIAKRMEAAKNEGASLYVSFHLNAEKNGTTARGAEVIYPNSNWKPDIGAKGKLLAENIQSELVGVGLHDRGIYYKNSSINERNPDGSLADYYAVQIEGKKSDIPGVIVEHAFMTNASDRSQFLQDEDGLKKLGEADARAIAKTLGKRVGWQYVDGKYYYYSGNQLTTGWQLIDGTWYFMDETGVMQTGWQLIQGYWYYFSVSGAMQTGWQYINNIWYYLNTYGVMQTGWQLINRHWYYFSAGGAMQTGWLHIDNNTYYLNKGGDMQTGWLYLDNSWYYMDTYGNMQAGWQRIGAVEYLFDTSGKMIEGAQSFIIDISKWQGTIDWDKVATIVDGVIVRCGHGDEYTETNGQWQDVKFEENIEALNRLGIPYGIYHYNTATTVEQAREQAKKAIALIKATNANPTMPVFVDIEQGAGQCDLVVIAQVYMEEIIANGYKPGIYANSYYWNNYLNDSSLTAYYRWVAAYGVNSGIPDTAVAPDDGFENYMMWQYTSKGIVDGITENTVDCNVMFRWNEMADSWKQIDGKWYYYKDGYLTRSWGFIGTKWYYFANSGVMQTGWQYINNHWYYFDASGAMQTGWQLVDGTWYYMEASGAMHIGWLYLNGCWYYLNKGGSMVTGEQVINGHTYYFNQGGILIG